MRDNVIRFPATNEVCASCRWPKICGRRVHEVADAGKGSAICRPLSRQSRIFHRGDELSWFYVLRSGSAKSYVISEDGCEQIVGFHYPGDLLGFDGVAGGFYQSSAVTLETSAICSLSYQRLLQLGSDAGETWLELLRTGAQQIANTQQHALLLGQKSAQARFASFLLKVSGRFAARGCSRSEFNLSMSRQDVANYLAVAVETVSRLFSDFQRRGMLEVERRFVRIVSLAALAELAHDEQRALGVSNG